MPGIYVLYLWLKRCWLKMLDIWYYQVGLVHAERGEAADNRPYASYLTWHQRPWRERYKVLRDDRLSKGIQIRTWRGLLDAKLAAAYGAAWVAILLVILLRDR
jgi:hypothetical protein